LLVISVAPTLGTERGDLCREASVGSRAAACGRFGSAEVLPALGQQ